MSGMGGSGNEALEAFLESPFAFRLLGGGSGIGTRGVPFLHRIMKPALGSGRRLRGLCRRGLHFLKPRRSSWLRTGVERGLRVRQSRAQESAADGCDPTLGGTALAAGGTEWGIVRHRGRRRRRTGPGCVEPPGHATIVRWGIRGSLAIAIAIPLALCGKHMDRAERRASASMHRGARPKSSHLPRRGAFRRAMAHARSQRCANAFVAWNDTARSPPPRKCAAVKVSKRILRLLLAPNA